MIKLVEEINNNNKLPNITSDKIVEIVKTTCPTTTNYEILTSTPKGNQLFVVSENTKGEVAVINYKPVEEPKLTTESVKT